MDSIVSSSRFKKIMKYRKLKAKLESVESDLKAFALNLAVTNDCLRIEHDKRDQMI